MNERSKRLFLYLPFFFVGRSGDMSFSAEDRDVSWLNGVLIILWYIVLRPVILLRRRTGRFFGVALEVLLRCRCIGWSLTSSAWQTTPVRFT